MAFLLPSRVLETTITTGTGTYTLAGAVTGFRAFSAPLSNSDTCIYYAEGGSDWELGYGTYSGGTIARTGIIKSSNSNNAVNWAAGTKTIGIAPIGPSDLDSTNLGRLHNALGIARKPPYYYNLGTIADDGVATVNLPAADAGMVGLLFNNSATGMGGLFKCRPFSTSPGAGDISLDASVTYGFYGTTLAGTTGTDAQFNIGATSARLDFENRTGAARALAVYLWPIGYTPGQGAL